MKSLLIFLSCATSFSYSIVSILVLTLYLVHNDFYKLDNNTIRLNPEELSKLKNKAPYLIAMATSDLSEYTFDDLNINNDVNEPVIPAPTNEPIVGVIDTLFDEKVYFNKWV